MKNFKFIRLFSKAALVWTALSLTLVTLTWRGMLPTTYVEVAGFLSGALCVWLIVKQNIWNWPLGIINATAYIFLFYSAGLYADMALQVMYIVLGFLGWYWWLRGGKNHTKLQVQRISLRHSLLLVAIGAVAFTFMHAYLVKIGDSAPVLDALTTVMSLVAQYMLTRKYIENWLVWIAADVIYIGLYISRELYLTSVLYAVFLTMCIIGFVTWRQSIAKKQTTAELSGATL